MSTKKSKASERKPSRKLVVRRLSTTVKAKVLGSTKSKDGKGMQAIVQIGNGKRFTRHLRREGDLWSGTIPDKENFPQGFGDAIAAVCKAAGFTYASRILHGEEEIHVLQCHYELEFPE